MQVHIHVFLRVHGAGSRVLMLDGHVSPEAGHEGSSSLSAEIIACNIVRESAGGGESGLTASRSAAAHQVQWGGGVAL